MQAVATIDDRVAEALWRNEHIAVMFAACVPCLAPAEGKDGPRS